MAKKASRKRRTQRRQYSDAPDDEYRQGYGFAHPAEDRARGVQEGQFRGQHLSRGSGQTSSHQGQAQQ